MSNDRTPTTLHDLAGERPVTASRIVHDGMVVDMVRDSIDFAPGVRFDREYVRHPGAAAVLALDDQDRVLLIRQYRHPVAQTLWELPAGLLDQEGEASHRAAQRELAEETDHEASTWRTLVDLRLSPGGSDEVVRVYLACGAVPVAGEPFARAEEEAEIEQAWVPLDDIVAGVLRGDLTGGSLVAGVLALVAHRARGGTVDQLRPADVPFPVRRDR